MIVWTIYRCFGHNNNNNNIIIITLAPRIMTSTQDVEALVTDSPISVVCVTQIIIFADLFFFLCF